MHDAARESKVSALQRLVRQGAGTKPELSLDKVGSQYKRREREGMKETNESIVLIRHCQWGCIPLHAAAEAGSTAAATFLMTLASLPAQIDFRDKVQ